MSTPITGKPVPQDPHRPAVELTSDYYGGDVVYHGKVIGIAGGTGAAFR
ncbi:MAG: hypothetical protein R3D52_14780 [Xanthobacteraceae bacterium]